MIDMGVGFMEDGMGGAETGPQHAGL
jgi:hypothetical protein